MAKTLLPYRVSAVLLLTALTLTGCGGGDGNSSTSPGTAVGGTAMGASSSVTSSVVTSSGGSSTTSATGSSAGGVYVEPTEVVDRNMVPSTVAVLDLEVSSVGLSALEADPFDSPKVAGAFVDANGTRFDPVDVGYRGAYALQSLIQSGEPQRNWKVKFAKDLPYQNRREWNFNFEPHVRQQMAYDLMRFAGVKVPSAEHVWLRVNGVDSGLYLKYEDPDNKTFLADKFGDDSGDLYKAAYDIPGQTPYFATLEYLGDLDANYEKHYRKMTNNDDPVKALDHANLRAFLKDLNAVADADFEAFVRKNFDTDKFISYLVVANFISHWDSYPERPKNFWLYNVVAANRWVYLPWDMDATFQTKKGYLNPMGTDASVFYQFDAFVEYEGRQAAEGTARPLVRRMMKVPALRTAYVARYREALTTFLEPSFLTNRIDKLTQLLLPLASGTMKSELSGASTEMKSFVQQRAAKVQAELATVP